MSKERPMLEVIAPSVEEAVEKGLKELGLCKEDVEVEVLDSGKRSLFKLASRQARVRLKMKLSDDVEINNLQQGEEANVELDENNSSSDESIVDDNDLDEGLKVARNTINTLLDEMNVEANVHVEYGEMDGQHIAPILINLEGNDLSFLIGRKSETINALQYITNLIVGKKLNRWIPLQIDVQNYRVRRERELRKLARRIADQVVTSGRKQYLEPMPPNERRIIHIELRENPDVITESSGEDPHRKVVVSLKD